jgi:hypothetical protein
VTDAVRRAQCGEQAREGGGGGERGDTCGDGAALNVRVVRGNGDDYVLHVFFDVGFGDANDLQ